MITPGHVFGRLTVLHVSRRLKTDDNYLRWTCRCACGRKVRVRAFSLKNHDTQSCGCVRRQRVSKHRKTGTPEYEAWYNAFRRCTDPHHPRFADYGGRGITFAAVWQPGNGFLRRGFVRFLQDMGKRPTRNHSLERINNAQGYSADNCRWSTAKQQRANQRPRQKQSTEELIEQGLDY